MYQAKVEPVAHECDLAILNVDDYEVREVALDDIDVVFLKFFNTKLLFHIL